MKMISSGPSLHGGAASLLTRLLVTSLALISTTQAQTDVSLPGPAADQFSVAARCPLSCGKDGNWALFRDYNELKSCDKTVLLNLNLYNKINAPTSAIGIRACAADSGASKLKVRQEFVVSSNFTPSAFDKTQNAADIQIFQKGNGGNAGSVQSAVSALAAQIGGASDGTTTALFAKSGGVVVGVYGGLQISKQHVYLPMVQYLANNDQRSKVCPP
jgi:hypothetical protein